MAWGCVRRLSIAIVAAHVVACSFGSFPVSRTKRPAPWRDTTYASVCESGKGVVLIDAVMAAIGGAGLLYSLDMRDDPLAHEAEAFSVIFGVPSAVIFVAYAASAGYGAGRANDCIRERRKPLPNSRAVAFTASARATAARGDCGTSIVLAEKARLEDERYYRLETRTDPAIRRCLETQGPGGR